jgi:hypothetical protein
MEAVADKLGVLVSINNKREHRPPVRAYTPAS